MKMVKLTNAVIEHLDNPIFINADWIVAVFPQNNITGGGQSTIVYGGPQGETWIVQEGVEEVIKKING